MNAPREKRLEFVVKVYKEMQLEEFEPWSGAKPWFEKLLKDELAFTYVNDFLAEWADMGNLSETDINDFIWFDMADMLIEEGFWKEEE